MFIQKLRRFSALFLLIVVVGCGGSEPNYVVTGGSASPPVSTVRLRSVLAQTAIPSEVQSLRATGYDAQLNLRFGPVSLEKAAVIEWNDVSVEVTDFVIEYLGPNGQIVGLAQVPVKLVGGEVFVIDNPTILFISSPLDRLTLSPTSVSIASGTSTTLTLTGHFSDGSTLELNSAASWTSSSAAVATVEAGTVQGKTPGTSVISATFGGKSAQSQLTVSDATLVSLSISPNSPAIAVNTSQEFTVEGFFSDGTFQDVTPDVEWESSDTDVATIAGGTALGLTPGQSTITATHLGKSDSTKLTVTPAQLLSITLEGVDSPLPIGTSTDIVATGHFSNATTQNLSSAVTWTVEPDTIARVIAGRVTGRQAGNATVTASLNGVVSSPKTLTVTNAVVTALRVETAVPNGPTLVNAGQTLPLKAVATYSDASELDVTDQASWFSSADTIATVSTTDSPRGQVTGVTPGQADISATFGGFPAQLQVTVQKAPHPELTLTSGIYTFDTDTGVLLPQIGGSLTPPGWNNAEKHFVLSTFTVESGASLEITGSLPFKVIAEEQISVSGTLDFSGQDGADGEDVFPSPISAGDGIAGEKGQLGGDINLFCIGDITVTGTIKANGGNGGNGGDINIAAPNRYFRSGGAGGDGADSGQIALVAGGNLDHSSASLEVNGGGGGDGGNIIILHSNTRITIAGDGGDGGNSGQIALAVGGNLYDSAASLDMKGGNGGNGGCVQISWHNERQAGATGGDGGNGGDGETHGGEGGNGGNVQMGGNNDFDTTIVGGSGGTGGDGGTHGGNGGDGGSIHIDGASDDTVTGGAGGSGGAGETQGGNGGSGGNVVAGSNLSDLKAGAGGDGGPGGTQGGNGGDGGGVEIGRATYLFATATGGAGGHGGDGGTQGGNGGNGGNVQIAYYNDGTATGGAKGKGGEPDGNDGVNGSPPPP